MKKLLKILALAKPLRPYLIPLAVAVLLGTSTYHAYQLTHIQPSQEELEAGREQLQAGRIRFDAATANDLKQRLDVPGKVELGDVGKSDPFSP